MGGREGGGGGTEKSAHIEIEEKSSIIKKYYHTDTYPSP